jgi:calcineurin-like phosphoesterase family protein
MNNSLINIWNQVVKKDDNVFVLGDLSHCASLNQVASCVSKLNGQLFLVLGNHDEFSPWEYIKMGFSAVHTSLKYYENVYMAHDPAAHTALPQGSILLCGHVHKWQPFDPNNRSIDPIIYNVGVDCHDLKPIKIGDVLKCIDLKVNYKDLVKEDN